MRRILVAGALGQIGVELVSALRKHYGADRVVASDLRAVASRSLATGGDYERLDCMQPSQIFEVMRRRDIGAVYHLAELLSAVAEKRPREAWTVNMGAAYNLLEGARESRCQLFFPSSIAAFGPSTPRRRTPQVTIERPTTIYGATKQPANCFAITIRGALASTRGAAAAGAHLERRLAGRRHN